MKSLSNLLHRSNLSPKERILLCVQSDIEEMKNGKKTLSQTDIDALTRSWKPKNNLEVREYNKYYYTWEITRNIMIDMQTTYLNTIIALKEAQTLVMVSQNYESESIKERLRNSLSMEDRERAHRLLTEESGIEYDKLVHCATILSLPKDIIEDLEKLYPDVVTEPEYLEQEMFFYEILKDTEILNDSDIKNIAEKIHQSIRFDYIDLVIKQDSNLKPSIFNDYFGSIPYMYFVASLAKHLNIIYGDDEDLKKKIYNLPQKEVLLKEEVVRCLKNGLLTEHYTPLCKSTSHDTCNGKSTKHQHKTLIETYVEKRRTIEDHVNRYIESQDLHIEIKERKLFSLTKTYSIISGFDLYELGGTESYSKDYRDGYNILLPFVELIVLIRNKDIEKQYATLLGYRDFLDRTAELLETNLEFSYQKYFKGIDQEIGILNSQINLLYETYTVYVDNKKPNGFPIELFCENLLLKIDNLQIQRGKGILLGIERVNRDWGYKAIDLLD